MAVDRAWSGCQAHSTTATHQMMANAPPTRERAAWRHGPAATKQTIAASLPGLLLLLLLLPCRSLVERAALELLRRSSIRWMGRASASSQFVEIPSSRQRESSNPKRRSRNHPTIHLPASRSFITPPLSSRTSHHYHHPNDGGPAPLRGRRRGRDQQPARALRRPRRAAAPPRGEAVRNMC